MEEAESLAEKGRARVQAEFPGWNVTSEALWGDPAKMLLKTAEVWRPEVLVVGSHGRSAAGRLLLGSVAMELIHHAACSVRVVRLPKEQNTGPVRILLATDGSEYTEAIVNHVVRRRWPEGTEAKVVAVLQTLVPTASAMVPALEGQTFAKEPAYSVIEASDERERLRLGQVTEAAADRLQAADLTVSATVIDGDPRHELLAEAERWHADTVFVGARGLGAIDRLLLGSVSSALVGHAACAVEVVRHG
jgi:nucleotide-binding universal stress UspA family protein